MSEELMSLRAHAKVNGQVGDRAAPWKHPTWMTRTGTIQKAGLWGLRLDIWHSQAMRKSGRLVLPTTQHGGAVGEARQTPQLPTLWPEVCKAREGFRTRELEAQLGRGGLVVNFRSFSGIWVWHEGGQNMQWRTEGQRKSWQSLPCHSCRCEKAGLRAWADYVRGHACLCSCGDAWAESCHPRQSTRRRLCLGGLRAQDTGERLRAGACVLRITTLKSLQDNRSLSVMVIEQRTTGIPEVETQVIQNKFHR